MYYNKVIENDAKIDKVKAKNSIAPSNYDTLSLTCHLLTGIYCICNNYHVSNFFKIEGKILQVG